MVGSPRGRPYHRRMTDTAAPRAELIATSWTSAGDVRPGTGRDVSPVPIEHRIELVAAAGYDGIGLGLPDLEHAAHALGWPTLRRRIEAAGLRHVEVEFLDDWWIDGPRRRRSDAARAALLVAAAELGARHIKVGCGAFGDPRDHAVLRRELRALAEQAAAHGTRVALEPGAGSALDLTGEAVPLLVAVDHPAAGLLLDPWHLVRAGIPYDQALAVIPRRLLIAVELSDGAAACQGTLFDDTFDRRVPPGHGDFDVAGFIRVLREAGYDGPWGVEVMSERTRASDPGDVLRECAGATRALLG